MCFPHHLTYPIHCICQMLSKGLLPKVYNSQSYGIVFSVKRKSFVLCCTRREARGYKFSSSSLMG